MTTSRAIVTKPFTKLPYLPVGEKTGVYEALVIEHSGWTTTRYIDLDVPLYPFNPDDWTRTVCENSGLLFLGFVPKSGQNLEPLPLAVRFFSELTGGKGRRPLVAHHAAIIINVSYVSITEPTQTLMERWTNFQREWTEKVEE